MISDDFEREEDEIISDTIFECDNDDKNFEINKTNILLWKKRLLTDRDELLIHNSWNAHIDRQKEVCKNCKSICRPNKKLRIGVSKNLQQNPVNGLRHPAGKGTTSWFIWTGEYSKDDDFFEPMCAEHLLQIRQDIIKYLGLDVGFRFLADNEGYEEVWYDEKLKII